MAVANKIQIFVQDLGRGVYNLHTNTLKDMLTKAATKVQQHLDKAQALKDSTLNKS